MRIGGKHPPFRRGDIGPALQQGAGQGARLRRQAQGLLAGRQFKVAGRFAQQFANGVFGEVALAAHIVQLGLGFGQLALGAGQVKLG